MFGSGFGVGVKGVECLGVDLVVLVRGNLVWGLKRECLRNV